MSLRQSLLVSSAVALTLTCGGGGGTVGPPVGTQPTNVLLIVADDFGVDMFSPYGAHPSSAPTPNLTALAAEGMLFEYFYSLPSCSPTRASVLTGRMPFRHGIGKPIDQWLPEHALQLDERTLPEVLKDGSATSIATSAVGKWHLGSEAEGGASHPNLQGVDWFAGTLGNLVFGSTYFDYSKVTNGGTSASRTYVTTEQVDDALARIEAMPEPWFLYLGFNAPHTPLHAPPASLHTQQLSGLPADTPNAHYHAMVEAMDRELGRLLAGIPASVRANTTIVFLGDNGTPGNVMAAPSMPGNSKGSVYEGGVRVPLIVAGKHVDAPGTRCAALVQASISFRRSWSSWAQTSRKVSATRARSTASRSRPTSPILPTSRCASSRWPNASLPMASAIRRATRPWRAMRVGSSYAATASRMRCSTCSTRRDIRSRSRIRASATSTTGT
ncbi:MAG: hypothetical protein FJ298_13645 [Planctomycetes bacterium]|nr:hypothetical protein [Planctomycetota bacterium]